MRQLIKKGYKPLCVARSGLITYHNGILYLYKNGVFDEILQIDNTLYSKTRNRLLERIFRIEPKSAVWFEDALFIALNDSILTIDIEGKCVTKKGTFRKKYIHTSRLSVIYGLKSFNDSVVYGEYFDNPSREEVCIFQSCGNEWKKVFSFAPGTVRHIHNMVPDAMHDCVYILTGDSDSESGIWKATKNFSVVEPLLVGSQKYRACIGFLFDNELCFATDIPSKDNYINSINLENMEIRSIQNIPGTCTTGCIVGDQMIFGTTVECEEPSGNRRIDRIKYLLSRKKAKGIQSDEVYLYLGTPTKGFAEIEHMKKDIFPGGLCQFGRIYVVTDEDSSGIYYYPIATKKYDGKMYHLDIR